MRLTNFQNGITSFGVPVFGNIGIGNVYFVGKTTDTVTWRELSKRYASSRYSDGTHVLYADDGDGLGIQAALDACVDSRNDYVVVAPSSTDYDLTAVLTMSKRDVHLIAPAGMGMKYGAANAVRLHQNTAATGMIYITGQACEVAGFFLKGATDSKCIYGTACHGVQIHHNMVGMSCTAGSATAFGIYLGPAETVHADIANNFVTCYEPIGAATLGGAIQIDNGTRSIVRENLITTGGTGVLAITFTVGIGLGGALTYAFDNRLSEYTVGVFTLGINQSVSGFCAGNEFGMTTANNAINGGTANEYAVRNYESTNGGTLAV